jgi:hypothetical protein
MTISLDEIKNVDVASLAVLMFSWLGEGGLNAKRM